MTLLLKYSLGSPISHSFSLWIQTSKEDLLQADFEGALKFFRVQLPKRYRAAENARRLMEQACNIKVGPVSQSLSHIITAVCSGILNSL